MENAQPVTGLILAAGRATRMGGLDKGLQPFRGRPMVEHVLERLRPQVEEILISVSPGAKQAYEGYGHRLVTDVLGEGPLAGIHAGMQAAWCPLLACVPCDTPLLPMDLVARLAAALEDSGADAAYARAGERRHFVCALVRCSLLPGLAAFLSGGGRRVEEWYATLDALEAGFDDQPDAFANLNTIQDMRRLEQECR